mgnify:FL=1
MNERIDYIDNLKGLGIVLVVFGHYIEPFRNVGFILNAVFICIYFFHMPMFVLLSGAVAKFRLYKVVRYIWVLYISQAFYMVLRLLVGNFKFINLKSFIVSFVSYPYFQLWYLYALIFWVMSLFIVNAFKKLGGYLLIPLVFILCIIGGFIDFRFGLNRVVAFYGFFFSGYILKDKIMFLFNKIPTKMAAVALIGIMFFITIISRNLNAEILWCNKNYSNGEYFWYERCGYFIAAFMIIFLLGCVMNKPIKILGWLGNRTMPVFIFHTVLYTIFDACGLHTILVGFNNIILAFLYAGAMTLINVFVFSRRHIIDALDRIWNLQNVHWRKKNV